VALVRQQAAADDAKAATAKAAAPQAAEDAAKAAANNAPATQAAADAAEAAAATNAATQTVADTAKAAAATAAATQMSAAADGGRRVALEPGAANVEDVLDGVELFDDEELVGNTLIKGVLASGVHGGVHNGLQLGSLNGRRDGGGRKNGPLAAESRPEDDDDTQWSPLPPLSSARRSAPAKASMKTERAAWEDERRTMSMFKSIDATLKRAAAAAHGATTSPASSTLVASPAGTVGDGHMFTARARASTMATAPAALSAALRTAVDGARNWDAGLKAADQALYDAEPRGQERKEEKNREDDTLYLETPPPSPPRPQRVRACLTGCRPPLPPRGAASFCSSSE